MRVRVVTAMLLAVGLAACGKGGDETKTAAPEPTPAQQKVMLASLPAPYNAGDPVNGKKQFGLCRSCHSIARGGPNMTGPHLYGVLGRKAGAIEDYNYSAAMKAAGGAWTPERLDHWLANPRTALPGTKMSFPGVPEARDRIDLIAYLRTQADS